HVSPWSLVALLAFHPLQVFFALVLLVLARSVVVSSHRLCPSPCPVMRPSPVWWAGVVRMRGCPWVSCCVLSWVLLSPSTCRCAPMLRRIVHHQGPVVHGHSGWCRQ